MNKGLGYFYVDDPRADNYRIGDALPSGLVLPEYKYWKPGRILDQGQEGACVGFAWAGWRNCTPVRERQQFDDSYGQSVYHRATDMDEWPGNWQNYSGTSNQAGAKVMVADGALQTYGWAYNYDDIVAWLKTFGPVVLTMPWHQGMYQTDKKGFIRPTGSVVGGHAMVCYGVNKYGHLRVQNSWGTDFGQGGRAWITKEDWLTLTSNPRGWSACTALELSKEV